MLLNDFEARDYKPELNAIGFGNTLQKGGIPRHAMTIIIFFYDICSLNE